MMRDDDDTLPLDPSEEAELLEALTAAVRPEALSDSRHERLIQFALEEPLGEPDEAELAEARALRNALESRGELPEAGLARALRHAVQPASELESRSAAQRALTALPRSRLVLVAVATTTVLSLAAGLALVLSPAAEQRPVPGLAESRSLSPLFAGAPVASESERLDRIVSVRSRELRDNRFARWGVPR
jgi:hypothetical protein